MGKSFNMVILQRERKMVTYNKFLLSLSVMMILQDNHLTTIKYTVVIIDNTRKCSAGIYLATELTVLLHYHVALDLRLKRFT